MPLFSVALESESAGRLGVILAFAVAEGEVAVAFGVESAGRFCPTSVGADGAAVAVPPDVGIVIAESIGRDCPSPDDPAEVDCCKSVAEVDVGC